MSRTTSLSLLAGAAFSLGLTGATVAEYDAPTSASNDEIRALVADMLADAETRSSLLQSGATAGHDGKFFLASPDGAFRLNVEGQMQIRYNLNFRDDGAGADDFEPGFQNRRTRLEFSGHIYDDWFFKVQQEFVRAGGGGRLLDAYVGYQFDNGMKIQMGQFKLPFLREELVSSKRQLAADRSFTNALFNQGRSQGIQLAWEQDNFRVMGAFSDGFGSLNSDLGADPADWALTGRIEYLGAGSWRQFNAFSSPQGNEGMAWMLGAAAHWEDGPDRPGLPNTDFFTWTFDASLQGDGWNAFGAFMGRHSDTGPGGNFDDFGWLAQAGIFVTEDIEPFVRWDQVLPDSGTAFNTLTVGANWYLHGHAAKFTVDLQWFLDDPAAVTSAFSPLGANTGLGYLSSPGEEDEFVIRAQFQLLF